MKILLRRLSKFFPIQLLLLHLRRSLLLLAFWALLFGLSGGWFFKTIGFHYLFEMPEYLGEVSALSYFIMGAILGFFVMAFHIASYIFYSYRFTFLATLRRPLYRFSINNSVIPILFYVFYGIVVARALHEDGFGIVKIVIMEGALILGSVVSIMISYTYFFTTLRGPKGEIKETKVPKPISLLIYRDKKLEPKANEERVYTYLRNFYTLRLARKSEHYDDEERLKTLQQHHLHAAIYFVALLLLVFVLGFFSSNRYFMIPAGASVVLLLTTYLMVFGALFSWLKTWTLSFLIALLLLFNYFSGVPQLQRNHFAPGLDYEQKPLPYNFAALQKMANDSIVAFDKKQMLAALEGWKHRQSDIKPKLVIFNSSGGGMRSSLFSMAALQYLDSLSAGKFYNNIFLIAGSSGGMVGSAYYRELQLRKANNELLGVNNRKYFEHLGTDILNEVSFAMTVNDFFIPLKHIKKGGFEYRFDRGAAWDERFNHNTNGLLNKSFMAYQPFEAQGKIPLMILSPTIINRGERLIISPMGLSFLCRHNPVLQTRESDLYDGVEFSRFFKMRQSDSLSFVTALRLSSTFPYITPMVSLPTEPKMEVTDAGARDNDGLLLTIRFLHEFQDWIAENTSGVLVVQALAARPATQEIGPNPYNTRFESMIKPIGAMVQSFGTLQGFTRAEMLSYADEWLDFKFEVVQLDLLQHKSDVSLSWHLTAREKQFIYQTVRGERLQDKFSTIVNSVE